VVTEVEVRVFVNVDVDRIVKVVEASIGIVVVVLK